MVCKCCVHLVLYKTAKSIRGRICWCSVKICVLTQESLRSCWIFSQKPQRRPLSSVLISLSTSTAAFPVAVVLSSSSFTMFLALAASSAALTIMPHLTHMSTRSVAVRFVHLGTNIAAKRLLPAERIALKNGYGD